MSDYLSHLTWCPNLDELTDWDLIDCLRGSMSVPPSSPFGADLLRERAQLIAEMDARNFPAEVVLSEMTAVMLECLSSSSNSAARQSSATPRSALKTNMVAIGVSGRKTCASVRCRSSAKQVIFERCG